MWEGGTFNLALEFTEEYPNKAPNVTFTTKMFHPNSACPRGLLPRSLRAAARLASHTAL